MTHLDHWKCACGVFLLRRYPLCEPTLTLTPKERARKFAARSRASMSRAGPSSSVGPSAAFASHADEESLALMRRLQAKLTCTPRSSCVLVRAWSSCVLKAQASVPRGAKHCTYGVRVPASGVLTSLGHYACRVYHAPWHHRLQEEDDAALAAQLAQEPNSRYSNPRPNAPHQRPPSPPPPSSAHETDLSSHTLSAPWRYTPVTAIGQQLTTALWQHSWRPRTAGRLEP